MAARTSTYFDTCKLTKVKFYLNSKFYPYDDLNLDFDAEPLFHDIYLCFRTSYYQIPRERNETIILIKLLFERFYFSNH